MSGVMAMPLRLFNGHTNIVFCVISTRLESLMNNRAKRFSPLGKHLLLIIIIKVVILYCLWFVLIKPYKVKVAIEQIYNVQPEVSNQKELSDDRR